MRGKLSGYYFGYFTAEIIEEGKTFFEFTPLGHPHLINVKAGVVVSANPTQLMQKRRIKVPSKKESIISQMIEKKTLIVIKFNNDNFEDVYNLVPANIKS